MYYHHHYHYNHYHLHHHHFLISNNDHDHQQHLYLLESPSTLNPSLTLKRPGTPPLDILRDHSAAQIFLTAPLADFLLSSLAHLMTPFSRKSGIPLRRCTTFYTYSSDQKWLKNVILCTKSM